MAVLVKLALVISLACYVDSIFGTLITSIEVEDPYLEEPIRGEVHDKLGYKCTYFEVGGGHGSGPRILRLICSKKTNSGEGKGKGKKGKRNKQKTQNQCEEKPIECDYKGNPHACNWYNKGNQRTFYREMAEKLAEENAGACSAQEVELQRRCPDVIFRKQKTVTSF